MVDPRSTTAPLSGAHMNRGSDMKRLVLGIAIVAGAACSAVASAQDKFPSRPVKLVVPATPGGPSDLVARYMGEKLAAIWGQPVVVENKAGGKQMIAAQAVAAAAPDGYTLLQGTSNMATNPIFTTKMPYDTAKDFASVTRTHSTPMWRSWSWARHRKRAHS